MIARCLSAQVCFHTGFKLSRSDMVMLYDDRASTRLEQMGLNEKRKKKSIIPSKLMLPNFRFLRASLGTAVVFPDRLYLANQSASRGPALDIQLQPVKIQFNIP